MALMSNVYLRPMRSARKPKKKGPNTAPSANREAIQDSSDVVMTSSKGFSSVRFSLVNFGRMGEDHVRDMPHPKAIRFTRKKIIHN